MFEPKAVNQTRQVLEKSRVRRFFGELDRIGKAVPQEIGREDMIVARERIDIMPPVLGKAAEAVPHFEEALKAGRETAPDVLNDYIFLPGVHPDVVRAVGGGRLALNQDALGIIETSNVPSAILAADKGIKNAQVTLFEVRLADGLHGKGLVIFGGLNADVEAAVDIASGALQPTQLVRQVVISQLHVEMARVIQANTRFGVQLGWE